MQNGIVLGAFGILTLCVLRLMFTYSVAVLLFYGMLFCAPVLATVLTQRYRRATTVPSEEFSFLSGFLHTLFTGFYAAIWIALFTFIYLQYLDHGALFDAYASMLEAPEVKAQLRAAGTLDQINQITDGQGIRGIADMMQRVGAATYAAMHIYLALILGPAISVVVGLICKKNGSDNLNTPQPLRP